MGNNCKSLSVMRNEIEYHNTISPTNKNNIKVFILQIIQHLEVSLENPSKEYEIEYNMFPRATEPIAFRFTPRK